MVARVKTCIIKLALKRLKFLQTLIVVLSIFQSDVQSVASHNRPSRLPPQMPSNREETPQYDRQSRLQASSSTTRTTTTFLMDTRMTHV